MPNQNIDEDELFAQWVQLLTSIEIIGARVTELHGENNTLEPVQGEHEWTIETNIGYDLTDEGNHVTTVKQCLSSELGNISATVQIACRVPGAKKLEQNILSAIMWRVAFPHAIQLVRSCLLRTGLDIQLHCPELPLVEIPSLIDILKGAAQD